VVRTITGIATGTRVTGLANGTGYTVAVRAVNTVGGGALRAASNTVRPATVPGAPVIRSPLRGPAAAPAPRSPAGGRPSPTAAIIGYRVTILRMSSATVNALGAGAPSARSGNVAPR
jgi:hypothetical protein